MVASPRFEPAPSAPVRSLRLNGLSGVLSRCDADCDVTRSKDRILRCAMAADRYDTVTRKLFCRRIFITVGRVRYILRTTTANQEVAGSSPAGPATVFRSIRARQGTFVACEHARKYFHGRSPARTSVRRVERSSQHDTILRLSLCNCGQVATPL